MFNVTLIFRKMPPPPTQPRCQRKQNTVDYIMSDYLYNLLFVVILLNVNIVKTHYKPFL